MFPQMANSLAALTGRPLAALTTMACALSGIGRLELPLEELLPAFTRDCSCTYLVPPYSNHSITVQLLLVLSGQTGSSLLPVLRVKFQTYHPAEITCFVESE